MSGFALPDPPQPLSAAILSTLAFVSLSPLCSQLTFPLLLFVRRAGLPCMPVLPSYLRPRTATRSLLPFVRLYIPGLARTSSSMFRARHACFFLLQPFPFYFPPSLLLFLCPLLLFPFFPPFSFRLSCPPHPACFLALSSSLLPLIFRVFPANVFFFSPARPLLHLPLSFPFPHLVPSLSPPFVLLLLPFLVLPFTSPPLPYPRLALFSRPFMSFLYSCCCFPPCSPPFFAFCAFSLAHSL